MTSHDLRTKATPGEIARAIAAGDILVSLLDDAAHEGRAWAEAAAEVTIEVTEDEELDAAAETELTDLVESLLSTTVITVEREKGRPFAGAFEAAARAALARGWPGLRRRAAHTPRH